MRGFNSKFYEFQALNSFSKSSSVMINIKIPDANKLPEEWLEIDGVIIKNGKLEVCIEVKSFPIFDKDIENILKKFNILKEKGYSFGDYTIVAPQFHIKKTYDINLVTFLPNINFIKKFYENYEPELPDLFINKLGWHHFRFQSPFAERSFKNQVDKRLTTTNKLKREIHNRLSWPPLRVFWSVLMYLSPKELFFSNSKGYPLGGPIFIDIDCTMFHYPCIIKNGICDKGLKIVENESKKLIDILIENDYSEIYRVFSGRKGFHFYIFDTKGKRKSDMIKERVNLVNMILKERIKIDAKKTTDIKLTTSFPTSLNGISLKEVKIMNKY